MSVVTELRAQLGDYPGRGIAVFRGDGQSTRWAYFLTGRSEASRSRRFRTVDGGVYVEPSGASASNDPLRHYLCFTTIEAGGSVVLGNGEQVAHVASVIRSGGSLRAAAEGLEPEPDSLLTPRITAVLGAEAQTLTVRSLPSGGVERRIDDVLLEANRLFVLHTYADVAGEPSGSAPAVLFEFPSGADAADKLWAALESDNRIMMCSGSVSDARPTRWWPPHTASV